jgi:hypothetical protein
MAMTHDVLLIHAAMTLVLAGVMWALQLTIIPVLARDTADSWPPHAELYRRVFRMLFWPLLVIEAGTGIAATLLHPAGIPAWLHGINLSLLLCAWTTIPVIRYAVGHGPVDRFHPAGFRTFARLNWVRVAIWTVRSVVVLTMLHLAAEARSGLS